MNIIYEIERSVVPEKVPPAEEFSLAAEALVGEVTVTVDTANTLGVPRPVQHIQQELVEDGLVAASACDDHGGGRRR